jgi:hypothetical protein
VRSACRSILLSLCSLTVGGSRETLSGSYSLGAPTDYHRHLVTIDRLSEWIGAERGLHRAPGLAGPSHRLAVWLSSRA